MYGIYHLEVEDEAEKRQAEAKMQRLLADPILKPLLEDLCHWLARILQIDITPENFTIPLQTGDDLCKLAIAISLKAEEQGMHCPKIRFKSGAKPGSFQARCNIEAFVKWAKDLGVKETCLFETVDIVELKYLRNVLICLLEISRLADRYGVEPPELVKLEKSTKIRWQDLIKLSMKRKSVAGGPQVLSLAAIASTIGEIQKEVSKADQEGIALERSSSVVKKWKAFTRSSLRSRGEAVSPDPNKILDDTPPQFGTPPSQFGTPESQSMLSDIVGTPIQSMMDIVEDAMEKSEVVETPLTIDIEVGTQEPELEEEPVTIDIEVEQSDSPNLDIEIEDLQPEDTAVLEIGLSTTDPDTEVGFEDVTEEPGSEKDEVHLTLELEDVVMPDDLEEFTVEEILDDDSTDQEFSMAVEAELVEVVHSQPDLEAQELDLDREATPTLETGAEVAIDVALDLETEEAVLEQDLELAVEQEFVEAVQTQPDLELESSGDEQEAALIVQSEPVIEADVILDSESSGDEQEITVAVKSERAVEEVVLEDGELEITVEQDVVEIVESRPEIDLGPSLDVAVVDIVAESETADKAEEESDMSEDEAVETQKISWKPQGDSEEEGEVTVVDVPLPSAPVMEILVHTEDQREVPVDVPDELAGHTNLAFEGDLSGEMSSSFEVSAPVSVEEPSVNVEVEDKVDVTWWFALCFPAVVEGNKDGSCLSEEQVEELDYKRSVYLLVGIILTVIGTALAITDGVLGTGVEGKLSEAGFFVILAFSLICLIAGLSLISLWVVQHLKMRNKKLTALGKSTDYGTIR